MQSWIASGGDDGRVSVYDISRPRAEQTPDGLPSQLVLQHIGHLGNIMDAQWSPSDPYTLMSVSNDSDTYKEGGAVQLWRLSWLLYSPIEQAEEQLRGYQAWLVRLDLLNAATPQRPLPSAAARRRAGPACACAHGCGRLSTSAPTRRRRGA